jgi:hypothetical protein
VADLIGLAFKQIPPHYALSFSPGNHKVVVNRIANFCCAKDWRTLLGLHSNEKLGLAARALVFFVFNPCAKQAGVGLKTKKPGCIATGLFFVGADERTRTFTR